MKLKRLEVIARIAAEREKQKAYRMGASQSSLTKAEQGLQQILGYRDEYRRTITEHGKGGVDVFSFTQFNAFLKHLDLSLESQQEKIINCRRQLQMDRGLWQQARARHQALAKLLERYRKAEQKQQEKREQRLLDDLAIRGFLKRQEED